MGYNHIDKKCGDCGVVKPVSEFYKAGARGRDGFCAVCRRARDRARSERKASAPYDQEARREYKLKALYGISLAEYQEKAASQGFCCAICGGAENRAMYGEPPRLVVDHNHDSGRVRGLLCCACNTRLAAIEDEQFMLLARAYLRRHDGTRFVNDLTAEELASLPRIAANHTPPAAAPVQEELF